MFGWICGTIRCRTNCWKRGAVWQKQTLWSVFVTTGQAGRTYKFISFPSFDCPRQTTPTVCSTAKHNTKFVVRVEVTATVSATCTVHLGCYCPGSEYFEGCARGILVHVRPACWTSWLHTSKTAILTRSGYGYRKRQSIIKPTSDAMIFTGVHKSQAPAWREKVLLNLWVLRVGLDSCHFSGT